jgi:NTE family protein
VSSSEPVSGDLALVLGGGGARSAYQAGVLRWLARRYPELRFPLITGVSAGAINASFLAAHQGTAAEAATALCRMWGGLSVDSVFRADVWSLAKKFLGWGCRLASCGLPVGPQPRGLVDTGPLRRLLQATIGDDRGAIPGIARNITAGVLRAVAVATVDYGTGQSVVWMQGPAARPWRKPQRIGIAGEIGVDHVMASAALPLFFPAVRLGGGWHGDGGIRLAPPFSPALRLGARRILAISTRYDRSQDEADRSAVAGYPPPAQILGQLMNAIFLDLFDEDAERIERLNALVDCGPADRSRQLRKVATLVLRPSLDLGRLAAEFEPRLPWAFRWATRGLGTRQTESPDALSTVLFQSDYTRRLIELGETDAESQRDILDAFLAA